MRVICIDDHPTGKNNLITKGKIYNVINTDSWEHEKEQISAYRIMCDNGVINGIVNTRFRPLEDYREILLNNLLESYNL